MAPTSTTHSSKTAGAGGIGSKRLAIEGLENDARETKKGLWVDPAPIPPLVYRKARRGQSLGLSDLVLVDAQTEGGASSRSPPLLGAIEQNSVSSITTSSSAQQARRVKTLLWVCPELSCSTRGLSPRGIPRSHVQAAFRDLLRKANFSDRFPLQSFRDIRENVFYCYCLTT